MQFTFQHIYKINMDMEEIKMNNFTFDIMLSIVFGIIGIILLITGYVAFDKVLKKVDFD